VLGLRPIIERRRYRRNDESNTDSELCYYSRCITALASQSKAMLIGSARLPSARRVLWALKPHRQPVAQPSQRSALVFINGRPAGRTDGGFDISV